jgi:hypothetical protein
VAKLNQSSCERCREMTAHSETIVASRGGPWRSRRRVSEFDDRGSVAAFASAARTPGFDEWVSSGVVSHGVTECARAHAVDYRGLVQAGERRVVEVAVEDLERFLDRGSAQVQ